MAFHDNQNVINTNISTQNKTGLSLFFLTHFISTQDSTILLTKMLASREPLGVIFKVWRKGLLCKLPLKGSFVQVVQRNTSCWCVSFTWQRCSCASEWQKCSFYWYHVQSSALLFNLTTSEDSSYLHAALLHGHWWRSVFYWNSSAFPSQWVRSSTALSLASMELCQLSLALSYDFRSGSFRRGEIR